MPKFFVREEQIDKNNIIIIGQDVNHLKKVLRVSIDDNLYICNSDSGENFLCNISVINDDNIVCSIIKKIEDSAESNIKVSIFQGLPKADKMEYIIQKAVELGVNDIYPVEMKRCVVKLNNKDKIKKIDRWQKISEVAAKQSGRDLIPEIKNVVNIEKVCNFIRNYDIVLVAYENEKDNTLKESINIFKKDISGNNDIKIGIVIGPEGGLEDNDVNALKKVGAKVISLGKRILRTETVALNVLSIIMYEFEDI